MCLSYKDYEEKEDLLKYIGKLKIFQTPFIQPIPPPFFLLLFCVFRNHKKIDGN